MAWKSRLAHEATLLHMFNCLLLGAACVSMAIAIAACNRPQPPGVAQTQIERGKMLVIGGACHDCHTPKKFGPNGPKPDMDRMLFGHPEGISVSAPYASAPGGPWAVATTADLTAWSGPWGVSFPANVTPDPLTGLRSGVWTEELFIKPIRTGKHMGIARDILHHAVELVRTVKRRRPQGHLGVLGNHSSY